MTEQYVSNMRLGKYSFVPDWGGEAVTIENVDVGNGKWRSYIYGDVSHPCYTIWDKTDSNGKPLPGAKGKPGKVVNIPVGWVEDSAACMDNTDILRLFRDVDRGADSAGYYVEYEAEKPEWSHVGIAPEDFQVVPMGELTVDLLIYRSGYEN